MHWPLQRHGLIFIFVLILFCKLSFLCLGAVAVSDKGMTSRHPLAANSTGFWSRSFRLYIISWLLLIFLLLKSFFCFCRSRSSHSFCCCCYFAFESRAFHLCVSPSHIFVFALVFVFIFAFAFVFTFVFVFVFVSVATESRDDLQTRLSYWAVWLLIQIISSFQMSKSPYKMIQTGCISKMYKNQNINALHCLMCTMHNIKQYAVHIISRFKE